MAGLWARLDLTERPGNAIKNLLELNKKIYKNIGKIQMPGTQISAFISEETKQHVEDYTKRRGIKKAYLIEQALLHYLQALEEIPEDIFVPARLILTPESMKHVADRIAADEEPAEELKKLMNTSPSDESP